MTWKNLKNENFLVAFFREFYLSGSYKDCCNMKVICLIEISSCLVKHTEVTQKYISELTELKKSKDYMQPDKTYFCISYLLPKTALLLHQPPWGNAWIILFGISRHTKTYSIYKETFTDTLIEKITIKKYFEIPFLPNVQGQMLSSHLAAFHTLKVYSGNLCWTMSQIYECDM